MGKYKLPDEYIELKNSSEIEAYLGDAKRVFFDFETPGLKWWVDGFRPASLGLWVEGQSFPAAINLLNMGDGELISITSILLGRKLYAFNMGFDGGVLLALNNSLPRKRRHKIKDVLMAMSGCSLVLFRHCANEGKQSHALEVAQQNLLGWHDSQKDILAKALADKGLKKADMYKLLEFDDTRDEFLYYNAVDAMSAGYVWLHLCSEIERLGIEGMVKFHEEEFACLVRDVVWSVWEGINLSKKEMKDVLVGEFSKMCEAQRQLRTHPLIKDKLEAWEKERLLQNATLIVENKLKVYSAPSIIADAIASYGKEDLEEVVEEEAPEDGTKVRSGWGKPVSNEEGKIFLPFQQAYVKIGKKYRGFNFASPDDLKVMLYEWLGSAEPATDEFGKPGFNITFQGRTVFVPPTEGGGIPTGADIYPIFKDVGKLLEKAAEHETMFGFAKSYLAASMDDGLIRPQVKVHGAHTGRGTGGGEGKNKKKNTSVNPQQLPKTHEEFMRCFKAPKGEIFVSRDFCLHPKTELLTKRGWVPCLEIEPADEVWQVNKETLKGSWATPQRVVKRSYSGNMHTFGQFRRGSLSVTDNHTMLWVGQQTHSSPSVHGKREVRLSQDGIGIQTTMALATKGSDLTSSYSRHEIWMACMLQADAHHISGDRYSVEVSIPRKRELIKELLGKGGNVHAPRAENRLETEQWSTRFSSELLNGKKFNLSGLGGNQVDAFVEALQFWDASSSLDNTGRFIYCSTSLHNIEEVQAYLVRNGYEAKLRLMGKPKKENHAQAYSLSIRKAVGIRVRPGHDHTVTQYEGMVGCVTVPEGFILVRSEGQTFITGNCALEKVVQAELSGDPVLTELYASEKHHDVHLYHTMKIHPNPQVREVLRQRYQTDKEILKQLKAEFNKERGETKGHSFAFDYGQGPYSMMRKAIIQGVDITFEEAKATHSMYNNLYKVYYAWGHELEQEYFHRNGYILDGFGFPIGIPSTPVNSYTGKPAALKDVKSRVVQRVGHYILMVWIKHIHAIKLERDLWDIETPVIPDLHDERIVRCKEKDVRIVDEIHEEALERANNELNPKIRFKLSPAYGPTLWDVKKPD